LFQKLNDCLDLLCKRLGQSLFSGVIFVGGDHVSFSEPVSAEQISIKQNGDRSSQEEVI
jgi:hypothetical protein